MNEYLPFIIGIAYVVYQFYNNYKKEQEKARNRNPSQPANEDGAPVPSRDRPVKPKPSPPRPVIPERKPEPVWQKTVPAPQPPKQPEPVLVEETYDPKRPYEPVYKPVYREPVYKEPVYERPVAEKKAPPAYLQTSKRVELTDPEDISDEVQKNRTIHGSHKHGFEFRKDEEEAFYEFDMRDAVIKEAILNRPQY